MTPERMLARAAQIDKMVARWTSNPQFADTCRMEAAALRFHAAALQREAPQRYRHRTRGTHYTLIGLARARCNVPILDEAFVQVYRGDDERLWVRPSDEFFDGRFEYIGG